MYVVCFVCACVSYLYVQSKSAVFFYYTFAYINRPKLALRERRVSCILPLFDFVTDSMLFL